jgi:hypothetical protein
MSDKTILRRWVEAALDNMGQDPEEAIREDYSGRGMYGDRCLGFTLDSATQIATLSAELCRQAMYEAASAEPATSVTAQEVTVAIESDANTGIDIVVNLFDAAREDSMGRGSIVYFPGWTLAED